MIQSPSPAATGQSIQTTQPVQLFRCTNCGGDDLPTIAGFGVTVLGLVIAVIAAILAKRAADSADDSLVVAQEALTIAREEGERSIVEHGEFMRQLQARAHFEVTVDAQGTDGDGMITAQPGRMNVRIQIGISNERGDKAAGTTTINALVPEQIQSVRWAGAGGEDIIGERSWPVPTTEGLPDGDGKEYTSVFLSRQLERVTRRTVAVLYFQFEAHVPEQGVYRVPVRVRVESDDLPDDQPEVVVDYLVRTRSWHTATA